MLHEINIETLGPTGEPMADAIQKCVHCGFCLPACPTYEVFGEEMDSPRGRIFLMKEVLEDRVAIADSLPYIDRCLGCVGCETACPSGVPYGELITSFRARAEQQRKRSLFDRLLRRFVLGTLPYPGRFRMAARMGGIGRMMRGILPGRLGEMLDLLPDQLPKPQPLPEIFPAEGPRRARVALLSGCAQQVLAPEINWATLRVLARNGVEVAIPRRQRCCGALAAHTGALEQAKQFARHNLEAFPDDVEAVLTNAAGCGSGIHEYPLWLRGEAEQSAAERFADRVMDVSVFLDKLGLRQQPSFHEPLRIAYHDACHLAHAQKIKTPPRRLLSAIDGLEVVEIPNGEICCGSAGTYNIEQPAAARQLGESKAKAILATGAGAVAAGNIGCLAQIETHLRQQGHKIPVVHTMQVLDAAYQGVRLVR